MRNKAVKACALAAGILFVLALTGTILTLRQSAPGGIEIVCQGETLYRGPGSTDGEVRYIDARGEWGFNCIRIDERGVCVESADCAGQECVRMGRLKSQYLPVVCLPHRLVIQYVRSEDESELDAVSE